MIIYFSCPDLLVGVVIHDFPAQPPSLVDLCSWYRSQEGGDPYNYCLPSVTLKKALAKSVAPPLENVIVTVCEFPACERD